MDDAKMKALAKDMIKAVKAYVTRQLSPLDARLLKLETQIAALEERLGAGK